MPGYPGHFLCLQPLSFMKILGKFFLALLSVAMGLLFLYSSYTKIYTLESFESFQYSVVQYVKLPWIIAALSSRLLIGLEAAVGVLIAVHFFGKSKWVLKAALALIVIFSIYLVYLWIYAGNNINCGCFGDAIWMSPSTSLLKNAGIAIGILILLRFHGGIDFKLRGFISSIVIICCMTVPFIYWPLPTTKPQWLQKDKFQLDMSKLYAPGKSDAPKVDLRKGKHVLAFFSAGCPHCRMAAYKMHIMKDRNPSLPFYMVIGGESNEQMKDFWNKTQAHNIPYCRLKAEDFTAMIGFSWPVIYYINNGWVEAQTNYIEMSQSSIEEWLAKP